MRCEEVQELLDSRELGEPVGSSPEIDVHVQQCRDCADFAADLNFASAQFVSVPMERLSEAKSRDTKSKIAALEVERRRQIAGEETGVFGRIIESLAQLIAGPRLAYGMGMAAVMLAAIAGMKMNQTPGTEVAVNPEPTMAPITTPAVEQPKPMQVAALPVKKQRVNLESGQVLLSGLLLTPTTKSTNFDVPEGRALTTMPGRSATIVLQDGTRVAMTSGSQIGVRERTLELSHGQVAIHVKKGGAGFTTFSPTMTTHVMGTRYVAGPNSVELVEGKVQVTGKSGGETILKPGESAVAKGGEPVATKPIATERLTTLYKFFAKLDGKDGLANDLGITVAKLDEMLTPTVLPPPVPTPKPISFGPARPMPGDFSLPAPEPENTETPKPEDKPEEK